MKRLSLFGILFLFAGCVHNEYFDRAGNKCVMVATFMYQNTHCVRGSNTENYNLNLKQESVPPKKDTNQNQ